MIKNNLSIIMGKKRLKMTDLARMTGLNKNTILNLYHERSKRIEFKVIDKICQSLKCQPGDLFKYISKGENKDLNHSVYNEEELSELYGEFLEEDAIFAEEGMEDYSPNLLREDEI